VRRRRWTPTLRFVPDHIPKPPYAATGRVTRLPESPVKSPEIIARMRRTGAIAAEVLRLAGEFVKPGITTDDIDAYVHEMCIARGAYPSPLNYRNFPKSVCTSVNEVICHGIPDGRELQHGDIVNIDVTCFAEGVHGDTNATFAVGAIGDEDRRLITLTEECMWLGIRAVRPGAPLSDIGRAIETHASKHELGVVRAFVGHGIGEQFHTDPQICHYYNPYDNAPMRTGMVFTIEPMLTLGSERHRMYKDGWTAVTLDDRRTAQFEHTVLVTNRSYEVLTGPGSVSRRPPADLHNAARR